MAARKKRDVSKKAKPKKAAPKPSPAKRAPKVVKSKAGRAKKARPAPAKRPTKKPAKKAPSKREKALLAEVRRLRRRTKTLEARELKFKRREAAYKGWDTRRMREARNAQPTVAELDGRDRHDHVVLKRMITNGDIRWHRFRHFSEQLGKTLLEIKNEWFSPKARR